VKQFGAILAEKPNMLDVQKGAAQAVKLGGGPVLHRGPNMNPIVVDQHARHGQTLPREDHAGVH
jgi:hypothetical protein